MPIGNLTWKWVHSILLSKLIKLFEFSPQLADGKIIDYKHLGAVTNVTGKVTGTVTNRLIYQGNGIERVEKAYSSDYIDSKKIMVPIVGSVNHIKECKEIVNVLDVSIVPQ